MNKYIFLAVLLLSLGCKDKKAVLPAQPLDIEVSQSGKIVLGELSIYPILHNGGVEKEYLRLKELSDKKGVLIRSHIPGNGYYSSPTSFFVANKSKFSGIISYGQLLKNDNNSYVMSEFMTILKPKKITEVLNKNIKNSYKTEEISQFYPILHCPPVPLKKFLTGKDLEAETWLKEALPYLDYSIAKDYKSIAIDFFGNNNQDENLTKRIPMEGLSNNLEAFLALFSPISKKENVSGYLVVYQNRLVVAHLYDSSDFFRKVWSDILTGIYLNQVMGYSASEMNNLRRFDGVDAMERQIVKIWGSKRVLPKDQAFRGDIDKKPFQLVLF